MRDEVTPLIATDFPDCSTERDKVPQTPGVEKTEQIPRKTKGARVCRAEYYSREKCSERKIQRVFAEGSPQVFKRMNQKQNKINNKDQRGFQKNKQKTIQKNQ